MAYLAGVSRSVDTGDTYFEEIASLSISGHTEAHHRINQRPLIRKMPVAGGKPLEARIEHARWIVDCPNCNSAEFAFEDKLFFCSLCKNSNIGGKVRKVKMPKDRKQIEAILEKRPIKNRHWYPNETIADLEKENKLHNLEVI